jgi:hypothetical protein
MNPNRQYPFLDVSCGKNASLRQLDDEVHYYLSRTTDAKPSFFYVEI